MKSVSILFIFMIALSAKGQTSLVADLDPLKYEPGGSTDAKQYAMHVSDGTRSFFVANESELWTSDGTTDGTRIVKRFISVSGVIVMNGIGYIAAHTDDVGVELWRSDGTVSGTILLRDIYQGRGDGSPQDFVIINNALYFSAHDKVYGRELWKTDGTTSGTQLVTDINPGSASSRPDKFAAFNDVLFFSANNGVLGREIWSHNPTTGATSILKDIKPGSGSSTPQDLVVANGKLIFTAMSAAHGRQLWKSDGTPSGTAMVKVIHPGGTTIFALTPGNNLVFFQGYDAAHGLELWRTDGTEEGTFLAKDLTPGPASGGGYGDEHLNYFYVVNGKLFFKASTPTSTSLWMSDGTPDGTIELPVSGEEFLVPWARFAFHDINGDAYFLGMGDWDMGNLYKCDMNGHITLVRKHVQETFDPYPIFTSMNGSHFFLAGEHYWKTDGTTAGTIRIKQVGYPAGSYPVEPQDLNGTLLFGTSGPRGLWRSEGTAASTIKIHEHMQPRPGKVMDDVLYFPGSPLGNDKYVLCRTDGTAEGTYILNSGALTPRAFSSANGLVFFSASDYQHGSELWQTDGTTAGTHITKDVNPGPGNTNPDNLIGVGNLMFFTNFTTGIGNELWRSDGTESGTYLVKDIYNGPTSSNIRQLVSFNGKLYFFADDGVNGVELWVSDGSPAGTYIVKNINNADASDQYDMATMYSTNDHIFFTAYEGGDMALWRSSGTEASTVKIKNIVSGGSPVFLGSTGEDVIFITGFETQMELWKSDGTPAGTRRLHSFSNQATYWIPEVAIRGNVIYFITEHMTNRNRFVWRTDGTNPGTYQIDFDGQPTRLESSGSHVYLVGISRKYGSELFVINDAVSGASEEIIQIMDETSVDVVKHYPNPFNAELTVSVQGQDGEAFDMDVLNMNGKSVFSQQALRCNTEHTFKANWSNGFYIMKVHHNQKVITKKIIKIH